MDCITGIYSDAKACLNGMKSLFFPESEKGNLETVINAAKRHRVNQLVIEPRVEERSSPTQKNSFIGSYFVRFRLGSLGTNYKAIDMPCTVCSTQRGKEWGIDVQEASRLSRNLAYKNMLSVVETAAKYIKVRIPGIEITYVLPESICDKLEQGQRLSDIVIE